jgi:hypothetical protein
MRRESIVKGWDFLGHGYAHLWLVAIRLPPSLSSRPMCPYGWPLSRQGGFICGIERGSQSHFQCCPLTSSAL